MSRQLSSLLLLTLWLGACTSSPATTQAVLEAATPVPAESTPAESTPAENSDPAPAAREAVLSEFEHQVTVKTSLDGEFIPAEKGFVLQQGGVLQTGETGRARLDLNPEGTIVRVAPNTAFTLPELTQTDGEPKTSIELFFGKVFVLLNGGSLNVETPSGVASVRGSLLSVSYNPATKRVQAACLEGHCGIVNEDGEVVDLVEGESAYVDENGDIFELDGIDQDEIQEWLEEAPELDEFLSELPDPQEYPEFEEFNEYDFEPSAYFDENPGEGDGFYFEEENMPDTTDPNATEDPTDADPNAPEDTPPDDGSNDSGG